MTHPEPPTVPCNRQNDYNTGFTSGSATLKDGIYSIRAGKLRSTKPPMIVNVGGQKVTIGPNIIKSIGILREIISVNDEDSSDTPPKSDSVESTDSVDMLPLFYDDESGCIYIESCPHDFRMLLHFLRRGEASMEFIEQHMAYSEFLKLFKVYNIKMDVKRCFHCMAVYEDSVNVLEPCLRHPGSPVVSSKRAPYWSCCNLPCMSIDNSGRHRAGHGCMSGRHEPDRGVELSTTLENTYALMVKKQADISIAATRGNETDFQYCKLGVSPLPHFCKKCPYKSAKGKNACKTPCTAPGESPPCASGADSDGSFVPPCASQGQCPLASKGDATVVDEDIDAAVSKPVESDDPAQINLETLKDEIKVTTPTKNSATASQTPPTLPPESEASESPRTGCDPRSCSQCPSAIHCRSESPQDVSKKLAQSKPTIRTPSIQMKRDDERKYSVITTNSITATLDSVYHSEDVYKMSAKKKPSNSRNEISKSDVVRHLDQKSPCGDCALKDRCEIYHSAQDGTTNKNSHCPISFMARNLSSDANKKRSPIHVDTTDIYAVEKVISEWTFVEDRIESLNIRYHNGEILNDEERQILDNAFQSGNPPVPPNTTKNSKNTYKTKFCPLYKVGNCKLPSHRCRFAHSHAERRFTEDLYKTQLCSFWTKGKCRAGASCRHAHGQDDLRARPDRKQQRANSEAPTESTVQQEESVRGSFRYSKQMNPRNSITVTSNKENFKTAETNRSTTPSHTRNLSVASSYNFLNDDEIVSTNDMRKGSFGHSTDLLPPVSLSDEDSIEHHRPTGRSMSIQHQRQPSHFVDHRRPTIDLIPQMDNMNGPLFYNIYPPINESSDSINHSAKKRSINKLNHDGMDSFPDHQDARFLETIPPRAYDPYETIYGSDVD